MRVLITQDKECSKRSLVKDLNETGHTVERVGSLVAASAALASSHFDVMVLHLQVPDDYSCQWLEGRRAAGESVPVLMLTERADTNDKIKCLNAGADDILVKPFNTAELMARLRALLRRSLSAVLLSLELGNIRFDTVKWETRVSGRILALSRSERKLLEHLLRRAGHIIPKHILEGGLYGFAEDVEPNALEAHVSRLRKKLEAADAGVQIHTLRGVGYLADDRSA